MITISNVHKPNDSNNDTIKKSIPFEMQKSSTISIIKKENNSTSSFDNSQLYHFKNGKVKLGNIESSTSEISVDESAFDLSYLKKNDQ